MSRFVSWYSGAKLAHTSIPYADQHMMKSHIAERPNRLELASPPTSSNVTFELDQSPVK